MKSWKGGRKVTDVRCEENVDNATDVGLRMTESCDWVTEDTEDRTGRDGEQEGVSSWGINRTQPLCLAGRVLFQGL